MICGGGGGIGGVSKTARVRVAELELYFRVKQLSSRGILFWSPQGNYFYLCVWPRKENNLLLVSSMSADNEYSTMNVQATFQATIKLLCKHALILAAKLPKPSLLSKSQPSRKDFAQ